MKRNFAASLLFAAVCAFSAAQPAVATGSDRWARSAARGLLPANVKPDDIVTERGMNILIQRLSHDISPQTDPPMTVTRPHQAMTRMHVLTALVKLSVPPGTVAGYRDDSASEMPLDGASVPLWGKPFVAAAVGEGWLRTDRALHAREAATWGFVDSVLAKMPVSPDAASEVPTAKSVKQDKADRLNPDSVTGVVIDASGIKIERAMSMRILDEDGHVLYPDPKHLPDMDYLEDHGLISYCLDSPDTDRTGARPLFIRALRGGSPNTEDIVVSNETAQKLIQANENGHCLWHWSVCMLSGSSVARK